MTQRSQINLVEKSKPAQRRESTATTENGPDARTHPMLALQRQVGNASISRLIAQRESSDDDQVMAMDSDHGADADIQAMPEVGLEGGQLSDQLSGRIQSQRGGGSSLDGGTRTSMESAFGESFDDVRVHQSSESDSLNRSISAKAFTTGSDIFLSQQASASDSHLLAHELTHVVQQRDMGTPSGNMTVGPAGDSHEQAAESAATAVSSGSTATAQRHAAESEQIERQEIPEEEEE